MFFLVIVCLSFHLQLLITFLISSNFFLICVIKQVFINPKYSLASLCYIEVLEPSQERKHSHICAWGLKFPSFYCLSIGFRNSSGKVIVFDFLYFICHVQCLRVVY